MSKATETALEFKRHLTGYFGERFVDFLLFGSRARGEEEELSDLDILIVIKDLKDKEEHWIWEEAAALSLEHDIVISPIVYECQEYLDSQELPFLSKVLREGSRL